MPLVLAPAIWWLFNQTSIDHTLIAPYYDAVRHSFPLKHDGFTQSVLYGGEKFAVVAVGTAVLGAFLLSFLVPHWTCQRRRLLWLFVGMAGATMLVSIVKHQSPLHCPWDLAEYGGYAPYLGLFDSLPADITPGRCFPSGHASGGFAIFSFYFAFRATHPRVARAALFAGLGLGLLMGWTQMMRGAHFLSHVVWSGWMEWVFLAVLVRLLPPHPAPSRDRGVLSD
ncbi:phosphatase PAP2 family protein [Noviherbaspirillum agri]